MSYFEYLFWMLVIDSLSWSDRKYRIVKYAFWSVWALALSFLLWNMF